MRYRLHAAYRNAGVLYPAGAVIEAEAEDLVILGPLAEALAEQDNRNEKPAPEDPNQSDTGAGDETQGGEDAALRAVLGEMDAADLERKKKAWWTREGKPEVSELRRRGHVLSAAERDQEWKRYFESKE